MKLLSLDFDGVIADSAREAFAVALRAYFALRPESKLRGADDTVLFGEFLARMPLGNRADDYGASLAAIEADVAFPDQAVYDAYFMTQDPEWLRAFHKRFYVERAALSDEDRANWLAMLGPYPALLDVLRRRAGACVYAIATAKDRRSVGMLLAAYGVADLFDPALVLDKETGVSKRAHHEHLGRVTGFAWADMTFVDDKVNHLDDVAGLGVRCALAAWGYNGPREHRLARAHGHLVCTLERVEAQLFEGATRPFKARPDVDERG